MTALRALEGFDLTPVAARLRESGLMPPSWVDEAVLEFRRYLGLHVVQDSPLPMFSRQVDDVWHAAILFTRLYTRLCEVVFGSYFHHEPHTAQHPHNGRSRGQFDRIYLRAFGPISRLWR
jgi:hypothetical protein